MARSHRHASTRAWPTAAVLVAGAVVLMAGCAPATGSAGPGPSATPSASSTTGPPVPCGTITPLRTALANLTRVRPSAKAPGQVVADLISIKAQLAAIKTTAAAYSARARPLDQAIDHVGSAAIAAARHPSGATVAALGSALGGLKASAQLLIAEMKAACPGS
jgi:hypothetical protein